MSSASSCFGLRRAKESAPRSEEWTDSTTTLDDAHTHASAASKFYTRSKSSSHAEVNGQQRRSKSFGRIRSVRKTPTNFPVGGAWQQQQLPTPPASSTSRSNSDASSQRYQSPIAVCGLALRLPGGIRDGDAFWDALVQGKDMRTSIPSSRYDPVGFSGSAPPYGYFLDEDLAALDTSFFNLRKSEVESADPQQRQLLEVARECLENAGETNYRGKAIGCYVGTFGEDWTHMMTKDEEHLESNPAGMPDLMLANRISYEFDLQGPR